MAETSSRKPMPKPSQVPISRCRVAPVGSVTASSASAGGGLVSLGASLTDISGSRLDSRALGLDDFRHGHTQPVVDDHDFAARHQAVVDIDVDRLADLAVELDHGTAAEF